MRFQLSSDGAPHTVRVDILENGHPILIGNPIYLHGAAPAEVKAPG